MRKILFTSFLIITCYSTQNFAHHAAEGTVSDELYEMIEDMLSGTPHDDITLDDLTAGMTSMTFTVDSMSAVNELIEFASDLNNVLSVTYEPASDESEFVVTIVTRGTSFIYNETSGEWEEKRLQNTEDIDY